MRGSERENTFSLVLRAMTLVHNSKHQHYKQKENSYRRVKASFYHCLWANLSRKDLHTTKLQSTHGHGFLSVCTSNKYCLSILYPVLFSPFVCFPSNYGTIKHKKGKMDVSLQMGSSGIWWISLWNVSGIQHCAKRQPSSTETITPSHTT